MMLVKQRGGAVIHQGHDGHTCCISRITSAILFGGGFFLLYSILISMPNMRMERALTTVVVYKVDPAVAPATVKINNSDTTTGSTGTTSKTEFTPDALPQLVHAPPNSITEYQDMDAMCTIQRYPRLLRMFCPVDRCYLKAFRAYFESHSARENIVGGCPLDEAVCYAKRYPDLFDGYCKDNETNCNYYPLRSHYEQHGKEKKRTWGCDSKPTRPAARFLR